MTIVPTELDEAKKALRATVLAARSNLSSQTRQAASDTIMQRLCGLDVCREAKNVLTYMSFGNELDTHSFFDTLLGDGKMVVLPRIDKSAKSLKLHVVKGRSELVAGVWGILEPQPHSQSIAITDIDLVLVPGVAFDPTGNRLGYGRGYYDRLLATTASKPLRVAAAFDCQVVDSVPSGPSDQPFHLLITETQLLRLPT